MIWFGFGLRRFSAARIDTIPGAAFYDAGILAKGSGLVGHFFCVGFEAATPRLGVIYTADFHGGGACSGYAFPFCARRALTRRSAALFHSDGCHTECMFLI